ncbi:MAG: hypothetical protein ACI4OO_03520 [Otoolea sp.]|nr:hypothetical protein [Clostridiaceae bacterium]
MRKKKERKSYGFLLLVSFWLAAAGRFPAAAAEIRDIRIHLWAEEFEENGTPVIEAEASGKKYEVLAVEPLELSKKQEYEIELASEEAEFGVLTQEDIRFSGVKAICTRAVRKDSRQTLLLTVQLEEPGELIGTVPFAALDGGCARWEPAPNASSYYVILFRDGKRLRDSHRTEGLSYDFSPLMREPGCYSCLVYPLTEKGKKGEKTESARKRLEQENTDEIRKTWNNRLQERFAVSEEIKGGWIRAEDGWYYFQKDGTLPSKTTLFLDGEWYRFDENGRWEEKH